MSNCFRVILAVFIILGFILGYILGDMYGDVSHIYEDREPTAHELLQGIHKQ